MGNKKARRQGSSGSGRTKTRAIELYHKDSPFKPKVIEDKRKKEPKHKKREIEE